MILRPDTHNKIHTDIPEIHIPPFPQEKTAASESYDNLNRKSLFGAGIPACSSGRRAKSHYDYEQSFEVFTLIRCFYYKVIKLQLRVLSEGA